MITEKDIKIGYIGKDSVHVWLDGPLFPKVGANPISLSVTKDGSKGPADLTQEAISVFMAGYESQAVAAIPIEEESPQDVEDQAQVSISAAVNKIIELETDSKRADDIKKKAAELDALINGTLEEETVTWRAKMAEKIINWSFYG